ncbi:MAG: NADH-quinone oxidoreductase subunit L [Chloroflexi bacterium]|nr:NADH-quinone oxidoreductase subunit L [Chloroflexota bacterium]
MFNLVPLVIALPIAGLLVNLALGKRLRGPQAGIVATLAAGLAFAVAVLLLIALQAEPEGAVVSLGNWITIGSFQVAWAFRVDTLSVTMMLVVTGVGTLIHAYSIGYMQGDARFARFFVYLNLFLAAMLLLVTADNFLLLFVGWEGVGLCSFLLIGFWFDKSGGEGWRNSNAARKAMIANRIGDAGLLLAMFALFWAFGSLNFADVFGTAEKSLAVGAPLATLITLLLLLGVTGKSAQIPLFVWLPDAMAGPTPASALIHAATMVTAGVYLIVRAAPLFTLAPFTQDVVAVVGTCTALLAASIAVGQFDIKRVLAYSTISQLGFMVAAVGLGAYTAGMFHLVTHAFFKALLFMAAGSVIHGVAHGAHTAKFDAQDMRHMGGLRGRMPVTFWTYLAGALALAGLPPLAGFFSKDEILTAAFEHRPVIYVLLTITAFLTAFYIARQAFLVFFGRGRSDAAHHAHDSGRIMLVPLIVLAALSVVGGALNLPGQHTLGGWLEHTTHEAEAGVFNATVAGISTVLALLGILLAYWRYGRQPAGERDPLQSALFTALNRRWWVDELYERLFIGPYNTLSRLIATFDKTAVDGAGLALGRATERVAEAVRRTQTGQLNWNVAGIVAGLAILLLIVAIGRGV